MQFTEVVALVLLLLLFILIVGFYIKVVEALDCLIQSDKRQAAIESQLDRMANDQEAILQELVAARLERTKGTRPPMAP